MRGNSGQWFLCCGSGCSWKRTIVGTLADVDAAVREHGEHKTEVIDLRERMRPPHRRLREVTPSAEDRDRAARAAPTHPDNIVRRRA